MLTLYSLLGNTQKLDGGSMFGNAPKALWSRYCPADELNRIDLACRAMLIQSEKRLILCETGIGVFFEPKLKERYGVQEEEHILLNSLEKLKITENQISDVVLSHLHFDHAGGLLAPYRKDQQLRLLFPSARYYVGEQAFQRAKFPHFRDRASFIPELPRLLEDSGRLELVRDPEKHSLAPFIRFHFSDGHTPGLMLAHVQGSQKEVVFVSDMIPGAPWVHLPLTMGYDRFPEKLIDEKQAFLEDAYQKGIYLFFTHDSRIALAQVHKDEKGKYSTCNEIPAAEALEL
jgi:glyoxylase-like metal-dependent hydrolase (beta-lactamase superfamily II)